MERRERRCKALKQVFVSTLTLALTLAISIMPFVSKNTQYKAYAGTATENGKVTLTAKLEKLNDQTTDKVKLVIEVANSEALKLSGVQFHVSYPQGFDLIEKSVGDFFDNGVSFFGPFKGEPNVTETARPMFCGFGSHGTDNDPREYVEKTTGNLVSLVFEANQPLSKETKYAFSIEGAQAFLLTTNKETQKPETQYYEITNPSGLTYTPEHSGGTVDTASGTTITAEVETTDPTTNKTTIKKQVIAKALENASAATTDIVINAKSTGGTAPQTKLEIPKDSVGAIAAKEKSLTLQTNAGQLNFSKEAAQGIHNKTDGENLVITVSKKDKIKIGQDQTADAVDFAVTAELVSGGNTPTPVTSFGGGEVEVTLDLPDVLQSVANKDIQCCYYNLANRNYTPVSGQIQKTDAGKKQFVFKTTHFSDYMVGAADTLIKYQRANNLKEGVTVSGTAIGWDDADNAQYLLYQDTVSDEEIKADIKLDAPRKALSTATKGESITKNKDGKRFDQTFHFESVANGTYKLAIYKKGKYVPKIIIVTIAGSNVDLDTQKLWLYGDVNYDGLIDSDDVFQINRYIAHKTSVFAKGSERDKADCLTAANVTSIVNSDTIVDSDDVFQINRYIAHKTSMFKKIE